MNKYILVLLLPFFITACSDIKKERLKIYSPDDFYTKIKFTDTACINADAIAKKDIKKGKISLNRSDMPSVKSFLNDEAINNVLNKLKIALDTVSIPSRWDEKTGGPKLFHPGCYQQTMRSYVMNKYDYFFIDSLMIIAEKSYVSKHPDDIYIMKDLDEDGNNGADDFDNVLEKIRLSYTYDFVYPKGYEFDNKKTSATTANFIILKDGTIKGLILKSTFKKMTNAKFTKYFNDYISGLISKEKWTSPYCVGLPVNAKIEISFRHK